MSFLPKSISKKELRENAMKFLRQTLLKEVKMDQPNADAKQKQRVEQQVKQRQAQLKIEPPTRTSVCESDQEFSSAFDNRNIVSFKDYLMQHQLDARDVFSKFRYQCKYGERNADFYVHADRYQCIYEDYQRVKLTQDLIEHLKELKREDVLFYQIHESKIAEVLANCNEYSRCDKDALWCFIKQCFHPITTTVSDEQKQILFQQFSYQSFQFLFKSCQNLEHRYRVLRKMDGQTPLPQLFKRIMYEMFTARNIINHFVRKTDLASLRLPQEVLNLDLVSEFIQHERDGIIDFIYKLYDYLAANLQRPDTAYQCMPLFELRAEPEFQQFYSELKRKCVRYSDAVLAVLADIYNYYVIYHAHKLLTAYVNQEFNECAFSGLITIKTDFEHVTLEEFSRDQMPRFWKLQDASISTQLKDDLDVTRMFLKRGVGIYAFYWLQINLKKLVGSIIANYNIQWQWLQQQPDNIILQNINCLENLEQECKDVFFKNIKLYTQHGQ